MTETQWVALVAAIVGGALRVGAPFLFVSLGECLTEKSGRINLGLEGVLVLSAMASFGGAYLSGSAAVGVLCGAMAGAVLASLHAALCSLKGVNDVATGIALMLFGTGLAFYFGKPLMQPQAPQIPALALGGWSDNPAVQAALQVNALLPLGLVLSGVLAWVFKSTRAGLVLRLVGDSADAARALGYSINRVRWAATACGGVIAGLGGASLSLFYPGSWNEGISSGQGLIAVALVIFARWSPLRCLYAAALFGGAGAIGPGLQSIGIGWGYHLFNTTPYVLTLAILMASCHPGSVAAGSPGELSSR
jgi:simple sugar transport system permease protein